MVRLYLTFSNYIFAGETRYAGCLCTSSGWFKRIERRQTFSNHIIAEIARCVEFFHRRSGWFDCTEPSLTIYIFTGDSRFAGCLCTSSGWFKRIEHLSRGNKCARRLCTSILFTPFTSSWWFKRIEPPRTFSCYGSFSCSIFCSFYCPSTGSLLLMLLLMLLLLLLLFLLLLLLP